MLLNNVDCRIKKASFVCKLNNKFAKKQNSRKRNSERTTKKIIRYNATETALLYRLRISQISLRQITKFIRNYFTTSLT